jgi:hypothetical protein
MADQDARSGFVNGRCPSSVFANAAGFDTLYREGIVEM